MSELQKKLMKENPAFRHLPPRPPMGHASSPLPSDTTASAAKRMQRNKPREYSVIPWSNYWDRYEDVVVEPSSTFRVYVKGSSGPAFFFLHGGGFSGLSWSLLSSILVKQIRCQCYAVDIRGHGDSHTPNDEDLSVDTLSNDIKHIVDHLWKEENPPIILVGHSMGGALAVHIAARNLIQNIITLVVIDVVEGSALDALSGMQTFLQGRPKLFNSIEQAIEYTVRSNSIRNLESARVSIIGQLKKLTSTSDQISQENCTENITPQLMGSQSYEVMQTELKEEDEENESAEQRPKRETPLPPVPASPEFKQPQKAVDKYVWRIDLTKTEKYWKEWFQGLSSLFLGVSCPKLLLLAGVDRLDKELMVGQMQGKFQMQVLGHCGHAVHEDQPEEVANALSNFVLRYKFTDSLEPISPPRLEC